MIEINNNIFALHTVRTSYIMRVTESGHLEHIYYGKRIKMSNGIDNLFERREFPYGNSAVYSEDYPALVMQDVKLEISAPGKGDNRERSIVLRYADGSTTSDLTFLSARENEAVAALETLPCSYVDGEISSLDVVLYDRAHGVKVLLSYIA